MTPHVQVLAADQRVPDAPAGGPPRPRPQAGHGHQVRHPGQTEDQQRPPAQRWGRVSDREPVHAENHFMLVLIGSDGFIALID